MNMNIGQPYITLLVLALGMWVLWSASTRSPQRPEDPVVEPVVIRSLQVEPVVIRSLQVEPDGVYSDSLSISQKAVYAKPFDTNIFSKHEGTYGVGW